MAEGMKRDIGPLARWFGTPDYTSSGIVARRPQKDKIKKSPGLARGNTNFLHPQIVPRKKTNKKRLAIFTVSRSLVSLVGAR